MRLCVFCDPQNFEEFHAKISLRIRAIQRSTKSSVDSPFMKFSRSDEPLKLSHDVLIRSCKFRDLN